MKTPDQFFGEWNGKGIDFDGFYGFQCVDLYQQYNKECVGGAVLHGNAVDFWNNFDHSHYYQIPNTIDNCPIKGDVVIWSQGVGQFGHIAVAKDGDSTSFTSFDQNWPIGSLCHFQPHSYKYVLGWLRPGRPPESTTTTQTTTTTWPETTTTVLTSTSTSSSSSTTMIPETTTITLPPESTTILPIPTPPHSFLARLIEWLRSIFG